MLVIKIKSAGIMITKSIKLICIVPCVCTILYTMHVKVYQGGKGHWIVN